MVLKRLEEGGGDKELKKFPRENPIDKFWETIMQIWLKKKKSEISPRVLD